MAPISDSYRCPSLYCLNNGKAGFCIRLHRAALGAYRVNFQTQGRGFFFQKSVLVAFWKPEKVTQ